MSVEALLYRGLVCQTRKEFDQAIRCYQEVLTLEPGHLQANRILGLLFQGAGRHGIALQHFHAALRVAPDDADLRMRAGQCLKALGDFAAAIAQLSLANKLRQNHAATLNDLGNVCRKAGELDAADEHLQTAARLHPTMETLGNLGLVRMARGEFAAAIALFDDALKLKHDEPGILWNKALVYFLMGDLARAWPYYEAGFTAHARPPRSFPLPRVSTASQIHGNILVYAEQGIGDEIMFASCLDDLRNITDRVIYECDDRLVTLFARSFPSVDVCGRIRNDDVCSIPGGLTTQWQVAAGSLPVLFRSSFDRFPRQSRYLKPAPDLATKWQARLDAIGNGLKIGISWRGGNLEEAVKRTTLPAQWAAVFSVPDCCFVNLQYDAKLDELDAIEKNANTKLHRWHDLDLYNDLENLAALIASLDLVVTMSNVNAHLAGALGTPVWNLVPAVPSWRWFMDRDDSPWYGSMRLRRQTRIGDWSDVIARMGNELGALAAAKHPKAKLQIVEE